MKKRWSGRSGGDSGRGAPQGRSSWRLGLYLFGTFLCLCRDDAISVSA
jgi:hypothetical protein